MQKESKERDNLGGWDLKLFYLYFSNLPINPVLPALIVNVEKTSLVVVFCFVYYTKPKQAAAWDCFQ